MRPIGIDLFAGAGGLSLGFEQAGFDVAAAVEVDPVHCAIHQYNFPRSAVIPKSVVGLNAGEIREASGIGARPVDCVFGGAPCQGFSLIGQRAFDDPRNKLVREFVRIVSELEARTFVFENVKGLTVGRHVAFLKELIEEFEGAGYEVAAPYQVLNAANYGTPQSRERLILMGARKGANVPAYPKPMTNVAGRAKRIAGLPGGPSCADALQDLPNADDYAGLVSSDSVEASDEFGVPSSYAMEMRCQSNDAWRMGYVRTWNPGVLTSSARTKHSEISRRRFSETDEGSVEPISRFFKLPRSGVANTLRAGTDGTRGAFTSPRPIHYEFDRCITVREMARLHGFPDWFRFHVTKWHGARQIGNAVPPPFARAVAAEVLKSLGVTAESPTEVLELENEALLSFDMTEAAHHFGIKVPPNRRDRKSGKTKRKQADIERELAAGAAPLG